MQETYEYELVDILFEIPYHIEQEGNSFVREDEVTPSEEKPATILEYDADGIPMGQSMAEIKEREVILKDFLARWALNNTAKRVYNESLEDYILVKGISVIEAKEHSSKSYRSTRAVMMIDEVLKKALPVRRIPTKKGNKNQAQFSYMLVMVYRDNDIGTIKLTVGVKSNEQHVEYGISALPSGKPLIDDSKNSNTQKKKKRRSY